MDYEWSSFKDFYSVSQYAPVINQEEFYGNFDFDADSYKKQVVNLAGRRVELEEEIS